MGTKCVQLCLVVCSLMPNNVQPFPYMLPSTSGSLESHNMIQNSRSFNGKYERTRLFYFQDGEDKQNGARTSEFSSLEPLEESDARKERESRSKQAQEHFATFGDELWSLRQYIESLSKKLVTALSEGDAKETAVRKLLRKAEKRDPELAYESARNEMNRAGKEGRMEQFEKYRLEAEDARSCLPHMNLEGLWIGKYGSKGYQMINVTYVDDMLVAYKVTGDTNVPKGEISFKADLDPTKLRSNLGESQRLAPIDLSDRAAAKWGTKKLSRYAGSGQVAEEGFKNNQWMEGQLIVIGEHYFSFAWLPISFQIFFGRPSPELALKMMRESGHYTSYTGPEPPALNADVDILKEFAMRCMDVTETAIEEEPDSDQYSCIWHSENTEECHFE